MKSRYAIAAHTVWYVGTDIETRAARAEDHPAYHAGHLAGVVWRSYAMWYVIQTRTGYEEALRGQLSDMASGLFTECYIPLFEDVWKRAGSGHISIRRLFPGYLFIATEQPSEVHQAMRRIPEFTRVLNMPEVDDKIFIPVEPEEEAFLRTITADGVMHASYVKKAPSGRIDEIAGPLATYARQIVKLDLPQRRAIVKAHLFGRERMIKFGLWTDADPRHVWLERQREQRTGDYREYLREYRFSEGDMIRDTSGIYRDQVFRVIGVDAVARTVLTETGMFGQSVRVELDADMVERV